MAFLAPIAIALIFAGVLVYVLRSHAIERDTYLQAVSHAITEGREERQYLAERLTEQASEMATRIQHPEIPRPDLRSVPEPGPEPEPEEAYEKVGRIFGDNGETPDESA